MGETLTPQEIHLAQCIIEVVMYANLLTGLGFSEEHVEGRIRQSPMWRWAWEGVTNLNAPGRQAVVPQHPIAKVDAGRHGEP